MIYPLRALAAAASDDLDLQWATIVGENSARCACRLGIWSSSADAMKFTPGAWEWSPEELLCAMYGRFLLETAMELEGDAQVGSTHTPEVP